MKRFFAVMVLSFGVAGCFSNYRPCAEFDLAPVRCRYPQPFEYGLFRNISGADRRFLYRDANRVDFDEYNRWISSPELLIMRALGGGFADVEVKADSPKLDLTVCRFGWAGDEAQLGVDYLLSLNDRRVGGHREYAKRAASDSPGDLAAAMNECVELLAKEIAGELPKFAAAGSVK